MFALLRRAQKTKKLSVEESEVLGLVKQELRRQDDQTITVKDMFTFRDEFTTRYWSIRTRHESMGGTTATF